jgi:O-antigen/teichoic acid export membrane protein
MKFFRNFHGLKDLSSIGIANILGSTISALFWIYLASLMGAENYGELSYYISIAGIATSISLVGGPKAITVLVAKKIKIESTIYFLSISSSIISSIILYFAFSNIGISAYVLGAVVYNLSVSELLGRKFYKKYSFYFILQKILFVILSLIFYYLIGPEGVLLGIGFSFLPFLERICRGLKDIKIDFKLLRSKWKFLTNNFILDLSYVLETQIDKLLIGPLFGFVILGNYYLAIQVLHMLAIVPEVVTKYTLPEDSSGTNTKKIKLLTVFFSVILALFGIFIVPQIVAFFFPEYSESLELIPIISLAIVPSTIASLFSAQLLAKEKSGFLVISSLTSMIILVIGILILGKSFGIIGLAYSLIISDSFRAFLLFMINLYEKKKNLRI